VTAAPPGGTFKYVQAAAVVRARIADGTLKPGDAAPSASALARVTGFNEMTCRQALRLLVRDGVLVAGASRLARPRVPSCASPEEQDAEDAARELSAGLIALRRAAGLTQRQLAALTGMSVTTVGHAETGRLWQSRQFWTAADAALAAGGRLLALHDACRAARPGKAAAGQEAAALPAMAGRTLTAVTITWSDGSVTNLRAVP
jgi:DNA-binding transcriptional regulator YhcF (GntR family)